jgi:transposase
MSVIASQTQLEPAIDTKLGAIFISLELSRSTWLITSILPGGGEKMSKYSLEASDVAGLFARIGYLREKALKKTGQLYPVVSIQEAGLDGFWIHRVLEREGVESYVTDAASVAMSRRRRRVKTDRLDGETLLRSLLAYKRGEPRVCAMVRPPSPEEEDRRRNSRERGALIAERVKLVNRIKGLLFCQGVREYAPLKRDRRKQFEALKTGDGRPLAAHLKAEILRLLERLELLIDHIKAVEVARDSLVTAEPVAARPAGRVGMLMRLRGVGPDFAEIIYSEGLCRHFDNRRQLASYAGLSPTPWQSGQVSFDQGVSKAGNPRLRTIMVQLSWFWLLHQPKSALAQWFQERVRLEGGRRRKTAIVALARKLLVALWKYVEFGVVIEGAVMKAA